MDDKQPPLVERPEGPPRTLKDAVSRAVTRAASSSVFLPTKKHVIFKQAKKQIVAPIAETYSQSRQTVDDAKALLQHMEQSGERLFPDVSDEELQRWTRNAQVAYIVHSLMIPLGAFFLMLGAQKPGFEGLATLLSGMLFMMFAAVRSLHLIRQILVFRERTVILPSRLLGQLHEHWLPLEPGHWGRPLILAAVPIPTAAMILSALYYAATV